jgi:hypothetical protein
MLSSPLIASDKSAVANELSAIFVDFGRDIEFEINKESSVTYIVSWLMESHS